jgi:Holliday junction resolvasome RuvABC endonuclease subunit
LNHRNIVFIRFNPDKYYDNKNILVESCWKVNKKGLLQIKDTDKWNERLNELSNKIDYWINNNNDKMINIENIFFDKNI